MGTNGRASRVSIHAVTAAAIALFALGCPSGDNSQALYDSGFDAGFAIDFWYWDGYFDGWDEFHATPIYYDTSGIQDVASPPYDSGFWDGVWYAYNDGYFVDYHYAFAIGFSEGYDNAFFPDYLDFLANDQHTEYLHGGWIDGYMDGYSEGRVFGANDFEQGLPFDWLDALLDYESGTDLYFAEINVGTGIYGPVTLYEYGLDPNTLKHRDVTHSSRAPLTIRHDKSKINVDTRSIFRILNNEATTDLEVTPSQSLRDSTTLRLTTTWLERVNAYIDATSKSLEKASESTRAHRVENENS